MTVDISGIEQIDRIESWLEWNVGLSWWFNPDMISATNYFKFVPQN